MGKHVAWDYEDTYYQVFPISPAGEAACAAWTVSVPETPANDRALQDIVAQLDMMISHAVATQ